MNTSDLKEQEIIRRNSLKQLIEMGINPYPAPLFPVNITSTEILEKYNPDQNNYDDIVIAGRIMSRRIMGKASFAEIQDGNGRIQIYLNRDELCPGENKSMYNTVFKKLLDIGDIIGVKGYAFITQVGEKSIFVKELFVLSKSIKPLPVVKEKDGIQYDAFQDPEQRYRQRYLDLIVNPSVKETFFKRSKLISSMRKFLLNKNYLEVETPILQPVHGGAAARPFKTHHNTHNQHQSFLLSSEAYATYYSNNDRR